MKKHYKLVPVEFVLQRHLKQYGYKSVTSWKVLKKLAKPKTIANLREFEKERTTSLKKGRLKKTVLVERIEYRDKLSGITETLIMSSISCANESHWIILLWHQRQKLLDKV